MVTSKNRRGLRDWLAQRITSVLVGGYAIFICVFILMHQPDIYQPWHDLFSSLVMKIITLIVFISLIWHAWIGMWTVFTDYVKRVAVRAVLETLVAILLFGYLLWLFEILWSTH